MVDAYGQHERARRVPEPGKRAQPTEPAQGAAVPRTGFAVRAIVFPRASDTT